MTHDNVDVFTPEQRAAIEQIVATAVTDAVGSLIEASRSTLGEWVDHYASTIATQDHGIALALWAATGCKGERPRRRPTPAEKRRSSELWKFVERGMSR